MMHRNVGGAVVDDVREASQYRVLYNFNGAAIRAVDVKLRAWTHRTIYAANLRLDRSLLVQQAERIR